MTLRERNPGELLPNILLNGDSKVLYNGKKPLHSLVLVDGRCSVLLVIGTSLKCPGAAGVVKDLAKIVRESGGVVIYINRQTLPASTWAQYFDLHIKTDIEEWAKHCLENTQNVSGLPGY